jgi:hypothetical protein|tara:strand:- start:1890 stop:2105 length:216 start_codon:yes stop_codon:yes gene_type:complete
MVLRMLDCVLDIYIMIKKDLTTNYNDAIMYYNYLTENYNLTNYEIYTTMIERNKDISWAYNVYFIEKYWNE